jgi:hypothetical protein
MDDDAPNETFADRVAREGEDAVARLVQELSEQPLVRSLIGRIFEARERAAQAQEVAMATLNIPSASDIERLTRRIRSVSLRMEGLEDAVDRLDERLAALAGNGELEARLTAIEQRLTEIAGDIGRLVAASAGAGSAQPPPRAAAKTAVKKKPAATPARAPRQPPVRGARQR